MAARVRLGIIGAGMMAQNVHLPNFARMPEVDLLAIASPHTGATAQCVKQYGIPEVFNNYRDLLALPEIDAVVVAVPNYLHAEISIHALRAGKDVLCERPMAIHVGEAEAICRAQQESGRVFMQGLPERFLAENQLLKDLIRKGHLGKAYYCKAGITLRRGCPGGGYTSRERSGGGALQHLGTPLLDLALWFLDYPNVRRVSATTFRKLGSAAVPRATGRDATVAAASRPWDMLSLRLWGRSGSRTSRSGAHGDSDVYDVEETACAMLHLAGGATLLLETSWALNCREDARYFQLYGDAGGAELFPLRLYRDLEGVPVDVLPHRPDPDPDEGLARHFIDAVVHGVEPEGTAEQGLMLARILESLYLSAERGTEVEMAPARSAPAQGDRR